MDVQGGCFCGAARYRASGDALMRKAQPKIFRRVDLPKPVTREFCAECGTHLVSRAPGLPGAVILKVGSLDDPRVFGGPQIAIFTVDKQSFHQIPPGVAVFERVPG